jgi:hypothetical protein
MNLEILSTNVDLVVLLVDSIASSTTFVGKYNNK